MSGDKPRVAIDTEGTGLNVWRGAKPFATSMCWNNGETAYWEWPVDPKTRQPVVPAADLKEISDITRDPSLVKCFWNAQFDVLALRTIGVETDLETIAEVSFMARSVNNLELAFALKPLADKYVDFDDGDQKDLKTAVIACRREAKKLGWDIATKETHGSECWKADYWLPSEMLRRQPKIAKKLGLVEGLCEKYAVGDAIRTIMLDAFYRVAMDDYDSEDDRLQCLGTYERELALLPISMDMEWHGVTVDGRRLKKLISACKKRVEKFKKRMQSHAGSETFNHNAHGQVAQLLFEPLPANATTPKGKPKKPAVDRDLCLRLPVMKRTKTGAPKTNAEALVPFMQNPIVRDLLALKANEKALSTFFGKYDDLAIEDDVGNLWLHPRWKQWDAITGRYTCAEPNMQQVSSPETTNSRSAEFVIGARQAFIPRKRRPMLGTVAGESEDDLSEELEYRWYAPDYSQVEVVLFADIAGEPTMLNAIKSGVDIHTATANNVWGGRDNPLAMTAASKVLRLANDPRHDSDGDVEDFMEEHDWDICAAESSVGQKLWRKLAKTVTFTKIFGGGANALMGWIGCGKTEALAILSDYDLAFPLMAQVMAEIIAEGLANGYVVNPYGRRLAVDKWYPYRAVNYLVQSSAADLMKDGMRKCHAYLKALGVDARIAMTIHDELIFEILRQHATKKLLKGLCKRMSDHGGRFSVKIGVDMERVEGRWSNKTKVNLGGAA